MTPEFSALLERQLDAVKEGSAAAWAALQRMGEQQRAGAYRVLACSDFVARAVTARQTLLPQLLNEGALATSRSLEDYQVLAEAVAGAAQGDETAFTAGIRPVARA